MRKITIDNAKIPNNRHKIMLLGQIGNSIFRTYDGNFINEHCSKLTPKKNGYSYSNRTWLKDAESAVLINDNRKEVSVLGDRGFITTSLVLEEFLQRNRVSNVTSLKEISFLLKTRVGLTQWHTSVRFIRLT